MKRLAALALILMLPACGLQPLYGDRNVSNTLRSVELAPIEGKAGYLVRSALEQRLGKPAGGAARFRLQIELDDQISGFGVRRDDSVTRERRVLRARYRLIETDGGTTVLDATAGSDSGIDVVSSEYAVVAAEETALERLTEIVSDQIVARVALYVKRSEAAPDKK
ncbi:MAG: LPS assembly lipoprotein LptE [Pseudomonadota bacterium]